MPTAGDVADFLLGGIPGDVHDLFVVDVEPGDLARAAGVMTQMSDTVRAIHVQLSGSVASLRAAGKEMAPLPSTASCGSRSVTDCACSSANVRRPVRS